MIEQLENALTNIGTVTVMAIVTMLIVQTVKLIKERRRKAREEQNIVIINIEEVKERLSKIEKAIF